MKNFVKLSGILFFGLLTAVMIYPFLHESGHSIAAILSGAPMLEFNLFPLPNIVCNMSNIDGISRVSIGLNGMVFPIVFSAIISLLPKRFWRGCLIFILDGISLLASLISMASVILFRSGRPIQNEDVTQILQGHPNSSVPILIFVIFLALYLVTKIVFDKPIEKYLTYFEV